MQTFEIYRNRAFVGTVKAVSLRQAVITAKRRHGRVEVIGTVTRGDAFHGIDDHRTEGRAPCNLGKAARVKLDAIRDNAVAEWKAKQEA